MKIFAIGMNYAAHHQELHGTLKRPDRPVIFTKADSALLNQVIETIAERKMESDVDSLFTETETTALEGDCSHLDSFELMAFFVVKEPAA